jgi:hypothetical protein
LVPEDILFVILSSIEKDLTYPLLFVSKKINKYIVNKKIICDKKYFVKYCAKSGLFNLLKWLKKMDVDWIIEYVNMQQKMDISKF